MNSTNAEQMTLPIRDLLRWKNCDDVMPFARVGKLLSKPYRVAHRKSSIWSWRLFQNYSASTHGSNDNDHSVNIVVPSHLPVSA